MIYENDRYISQRIKEILKSKMAILIYSPGSYWFISPRNFKMEKYTVESLKLREVRYREYIF